MIIDPMYVGDYQIKITSQRLKSGKYQVKFHAMAPEKKSFYGYILAEPGTTLKEVVANIKKKLNLLKKPDHYYHARLLDMGRKDNVRQNFLLFNT
ncbi:MAG: hypothetical protein AAFX87_05885 [Bacteroidota bacterium]